MKKVTEALPGITIVTLSMISIAIIVFIFFFVISRALPVIQASGPSLLTTGGFDRQIREAFYALPDDPLLEFGLLGLLSGTLITTGIALLFATIIGIGAAIVICEYASRTVSVVLIAIVRLLASVPSVVFGLIGIITVLPFVESVFVTVERQIEYLDYFQMTGRSLLAAAIVLTFMIVPTVVSLSVDAIRAVPHIYRETGYAFGMNKFRVISRVILPSARSGIVAGILLGGSRGIGEAIAVSMVCGGVGFVPRANLGFINFLAPTLPLASAIVNKSEAMGSHSVEAALFACGALLLVIGALFSLATRFVENWLRKAAGYND